MLDESDLCTYFLVVPCSDEHVKYEPLYVI